MNYSKLHKKAYELFSEEFCEDCGMPNKVHLQRYKQRLHMHNMEYPKNYEKMSRESWQCLCRDCHRIKEDLLKKLDIIIQITK